jgi:hypothetical protein
MDNLTTAVRDGDRLTTTPGPFALDKASRELQSAPDGANLRCGWGADVPVDIAPRDMAARQLEASTS